LRSAVEIVYPELPKNTLVYLPESERSVLLNRYTNLSSSENIITIEGEVGQAQVGQNFVASKKGTRFYPVDCKSSARIKPENKIYFNTADDAQRAGLTLASGCSL
jgi:DNA/RNA endonuclease YhcR with UshA esterase domain